MDGYEAMRRIRTNPALRSIPIIAVTSFAPSGEEQKARAAGCDESSPAVRAGCKVSVHELHGLRYAWVIGICLRSRYTANFSDPLPMIWLGDG